ncbi:MAG TPA: zf-TFIIB domain-containing protein [Dehalococcoidia bacterium]|nr:zf-TFIIB domain-containing protein [Dehalococcoidia bacterium]
MNCPKCGAPMRERERGDVIMDVCPSGHGIWLDSGELERLTEQRREYVRSHPGYRPDDDDDDEWYYRRGDRGNRDQYGQPRKKKGFLSTLMESFGGEGADD